VCTLTWLHRADGYAVFLNRDESRRRLPAEPPAVRRQGGLRFIAPLDGDGGGTWIAVNERGASFCLLNGPAAALRPADAEIATRGRIPLALVESSSPEAAAAALRALPLDRFRPFELVMFAPGGRGLLGRWSGTALELQLEPPAVQPLVSSSFSSEEVRRSRIAVFRRLESAGRSDRGETHLAYHRSHEPERGPRSPCMHRDDARTVSFSRVEVGGREIRFDYVPHAPCAGGPVQTLRLPRRPPAGGAP